MAKRRGHGEFALRQARNGLLDLQGDLLTSTLVPRRIDGAETALAKKATDALMLQWVQGTCSAQAPQST